MQGYLQGKEFLLKRIFRLFYTDITFRMSVHQNLLRQFLFTALLICSVCQQIIISY